MNEIDTEKYYAVVIEGVVENVVISCHPHSENWHPIPIGESVGVTYLFDGVNFKAPQMASPIEDKNKWWITVQAFQRRLGMDGLAIAASQSPVCLACKERLRGVPYVDLKSDDVTALLGLLIVNQQPVGFKEFPGSGPMTKEKMAEILGKEPELNERANG